MNLDENLNIRFPLTGWVNVGMDDLGPDERETCSFCNKQQIRYVHIMSHPKYLTELRCGCVCAGRMEGNEDNAVIRQKDFEKEVSKKARASTKPVVVSRTPDASWYPTYARRGLRVTRSWTLAKSGVQQYQWFSIDGVDGFALVSPRGNGWDYKIVNKVTKKEDRSITVYESEDEAKAAADNRLEEYARKRASAA